MMRMIAIATMIQIKQIATVLSVLLISTTVSAQKVVVSGDYVVIDNRNMPANAITNQPGKIVTPTTLAEGTEQNKQINHYFAVSKAANNGNNLATWATASTTCPNYDSGDGPGRWRMPTQRELMLMWILKDKLTATQGMTPFESSEYWSGTMNDGTVGSESSWAVSFNPSLNPGLTSGKVHFDKGSSKYNSSMVRCVRDLAP